MKRCWVAALVTALSLVVAATAQARTAYVAVSFGTDSVVFLDDQMHAVSGGFGLADDFPNGVAASGNTIYTGHFIDDSIVAYNAAGQQQLRWSDPALFRLSGLAAVGSSLVAASDDRLFLFNGPGFHTAELQLGESVEGVTYDGQVMWTLGSQLVARDFTTGQVVRSIPNAALGCPFGGTGIAPSGAGMLMLGCSDGQWFRVSSADGAVLASGNNGVDMFDLAALPVPEVPTPALLLAGLLALGARRRWCRLSDSNG